MIKMKNRFKNSQCDLLKYIFLKNLKTKTHKLKNYLIDEYGVKANMVEYERKNKVFLLPISKTYYQEIYDDEILDIIWDYSDTMILELLQYLAFEYSLDCTQIVLNFCEKKIFNCYGNQVRIFKLSFTIDSNEY